MSRLPMNIIAAIDKNFGIGKDNQLPWHLPTEYRHFVRLTTLTNESGKMNAVIMGRKCWESIPERYRPLKGRLNIILSRSMEPMISEELIVTNSIENAMEVLSSNLFKNKIETLWNVGGHDIYKIGLTHPQLCKLVLTRLDKDFECDVKFPEIDWDLFEPDVDFKDSLPVEEKGIKWHITSYQMFPFNTPYNYLLNWSIVCFAVPWLYSYFNEQHRLSSMPVEQAMLKAWENVITQPSIKFRKVMVGINCNVDVIISGVNIINKLNISSPNPIGDKEMLNGFEDLYEAFVHFFSRGAPAERFMANEDAFDKIIATLEDKHELRVQHYIGGNAALMAQKIAGSFPHATAYLIGPIGPRSQALLHPAIVPNNSTRITQDEMHVILEYKQGEILGEYVAPASSRFIISHDQFSGSAMVIEMFFKAIMQLRPDLILLSGIHVLEVQNQDVRLEKLRLIKRSLLQVNPLIPIHLQLGSMADASIADDILKRIIPNVDSLGINEQELTFLSKVGGGPFNERYPISAGTLHAYKAVEMLYWLLNTYGHDRSNPEGKSYNHRLQRIHFFSLTYHIMVSKGPDWSNLAAGLAAGARLAGRQSCSLNMAASDRADFDKLEIRSSQTVLLDKQINKVYQFNPHSPLASWMRGDLVFLYTPVLVCKYPQLTVGVDDAISSTALLYSQFYKLEKRTW